MSQSLFSCSATTDVARRIAVILLLGPKLDASYDAVKGHAIDWKTLAKR